MSWPYDHDRPGTPIPKKDKAQPDTTSDAWDSMAPRWMMIDTLLGGTEEMRRAGTLYLPQHPQESPIGYQNRLNRAILLNVFELTVQHLSGRPFSEKMKIVELLPELENLMEDVDTLGTTIDNFCQAWFKNALAKGFSHVLVDMPQLETGGVIRTLEDDRNEQRRPYLVQVPPENVIFARSEVINGQEVLTHVRIREQVTVPNGFTDTVIDQIRVLKPGHVTLWRNAKDQKRSNARNKWVIFTEWDVALQTIPLLTFYTGRTGFMTAKPPLLDLAYMNVSHWQSLADQINVLTVARFPMLAASGVSDEEGIIKVGPNQILTTTDSGGKFYYVEHTGAAIESGQKALNHLEEKMAAYGAQFLKQQPDRASATARVLDSAETMGGLGAMVNAFSEVVENVFNLMADWLNLTISNASSGHVELDASYGLDETTQWELQTLQLTRQGRDISRKTYLEELMRRRVLNQDYDIEADVDQIQQETAQGLGPPVTGDLNPAAPPKDVGPKET